MALLLSCQSLTASFGAHPLFDEISLSISDGDRLGPARCERPHPGRSRWEPGTQQVTRHRIVIVSGPLTAEQAEQRYREFASSAP